MTIRTISALSAMLFLAACGGAESDAESTDAAAAPEAEEQVLNLYSSRHYDTDDSLYENFTAQTGIRINRLEAGADELITRIAADGEFSPADLLITVDAGRLWRAEQEGLFEAVDSAVLSERVPESLRHPDGLWFGLSTRARVIIYNREAGKPEPLADYQDLANPAHAGKVCIRSSSNIYNLSLMASLISHVGAEAAEGWAKGVVANFARTPQSNDTGQIRSVASGECGIAVVNTYYLARLLASDNEEDRALAANVGVVFPNQGSTGTHVNISGAGLIKTAPNRENAIAYLEYLTTVEAQKILADGNHEYPVVDGVVGSEALQSLGEFTADSLNTSNLGKNQAEAVQIYDRAGWQ